MISGLNELDHICRQSCRCKAVSDHPDNSGIGCDGVASALENDGVARLESERKRIRCHIRTRLVNDADDAERHALLSYHQAIRTPVHGKD